MRDLVTSPMFLMLLTAVAAGVALLVLWVTARRRLTDQQRRVDLLESDLHRLNEQLDGARRMEAVGIMAGGIVHNLNNLLAVILGHSRIASQDLPDTSPARLEIQRVLQAGEMAGDLVRDISDFYLQADRARKPIELAPVVRDTLKLIRDILPATVELKIELETTGPVLATPTGVQQVLMNLCSNAMQAMYRQRGTLEVTLAQEKVTEERPAVPENLVPGRYVRLTIKDDGRGMDKETLEGVLGANFSGSTNGTRAGIGLSTVSRILRDHDGVAAAKSRIGEGTVFDLYFPLIAWEVATDPVVSEPRVVYHPHKPQEETQVVLADSARTLLLVDDEEMVAQVLARGLRRLGFRVITHTDSRTALADFAQTPEIFDAVVTDQIMPHMSGVRLAKRILKIRPDLPIILFTGFRDSFNEQQAREAGVTEFLLKPGSHRDLADLIKRLQKRKMAGRA
jgi:signal transduction histidine kinase/CheY-like chemotaxis protein